MIISWPKLVIFAREGMGFPSVRSQWTSGVGLQKWQGEELFVEGKELDMASVPNRTFALDAITVVDAHLVVHITQTLSS